MIADAPYEAGDLILTPSLGILAGLVSAIAVAGTVAQHGARLALITWPTLLTPSLLADDDVHQRLTLYYSATPLSTQGLWTWYSRWIEEQRSFAATFEDVIMVDATAAMGDATRAERLRFFTDLAHLTVDGNSELAEVVLQRLTASGAVP